MTVTAYDNTTAGGAGLSAKIEYARALAGSNLLPKQYRQEPANVLLAMELGDALGIPNIQAITGIHVVEGKPSMSADLMASMVRRAGHKLRVNVDDQQLVAVAQLIRSDDPEYTFEVRWDMGKARTAGLTGKNNWKQHPGQMLRSRAITEVCRMGASDALFGVIYTPEDLGADVTADGDVVVSQQQGPGGVDQSMKITDAIEQTSAAGGEHPDPSETVMITTEQKKTLNALIKRHALSAQEALPRFSEWVGREVSATRDLSAAEAAIVINELQVNKETGEIIDAEIVEDSAPSGDGDGVEAQQEEIRRLNEERRTLQGKAGQDARPDTRSSSGRVSHKQASAGCSTEQQALVQMHFKRLKVSDRDERLEWTARIAGREQVGSTKELSVAEASTVIDFLAARTGYQDLAQSLVQDVLDAEPVAETEVQS